MESIRKGFLFFLIFLLYANLATSQFSQIRFEKIDIRDGLSHNRVNSIYKDQLGFIWFGTPNGLNRFDGNTIRVFEGSGADLFSPVTDDVVWLKEGPGGNLWIKTNYGVFAFDIYIEKFVDISKLLSELQINNYNLSDLIRDDVGNYWFVIDGIGVKKFISSENRIYHFGAAYRDVTSIQRDNDGSIALVHQDGEIELVNVYEESKSVIIPYPEHIREQPDVRLFIDDENEFWFFSSNFQFGVCRYNPENKRCIHYGEKELGSNIVSGILQDVNSKILIGLDHGGLNSISKVTGQIRNFKNNAFDTKSLSHNSIISMYSDNSGIIWLGTNKGGVNYYSPNSVRFKFYKQANGPTNSNDILEILEASGNNLWLGTDGGGLSHLDFSSGKFTNYTHDINDPTSISSDIIVSMCESPNGGLWIGTYHGGLNYFDGKKFRHFYRDESDPNALSDNSIWKLFIDSKKNLWVGTLKKGVDVYDSTLSKIKHLSIENNLLHSNYVTSFTEDQNGFIWIGTGYGIDLYDPATETTRNILNDVTDPKSLSNNSVVEIYCDENNQIWIGTMHGLNRYNREDETFDGFTKEDGLPSNIINSIVRADNGDLWLGTHKGLSRLTNIYGDISFENFDISDGLQGDAFNERSAVKLKNGNIIFGGKNGFNVLNPNHITYEEEKDQLVFLDFYISNKRIVPGEEYGGKTWFEKGLNSTSSIELAHDQNSFTFEFTSLDYFQPENIRYKYRLVGFDDDWVILPNTHRANYTNLDPGKYRFEVATSDPSEVLDMSIEIVPPLWATPWAYLAYFISMITVLMVTWRAIVNRERFKARIAQDQLEARRQHEIDLMKIKFFTNISHEFRTPLTLILTPVERLLNLRKDNSDNRHLRVVYRNAKRLLTLVNQLLDFRKMESKQHRLSLSLGDLITFTEQIVDSFSDLSEDKRIRLEFEPEINEFFTAFDRDKLEKIIFNLLSNAFKFTHSGGKITLSIRDNGLNAHTHQIQLSVQDTGIGIPREKLKDIFNRFYQVDDNSITHHGSGIGLSITREFVEMHRGRIWVESEPDRGSTFYVEIPLQKISKNEDKITEGLTELPATSRAFDAKKETVLIADDNDDFRFYLMDNLLKGFNIIEAGNGREAWNKMIKHPPDLVVSDIMMPEMTGITLCKKIKSDPRTAHIPVILLTAHYSDDQKLEGYEAGAIEYITKPFNFEILINAIRSAVQLQKLIHTAEKRMKVNPSEIEFTSRDREFIEKAKSVVEEHIEDPDFSVQQLSHELGVSRGLLYKKVIELSGITPIEFIRTMRIKRAADLLLKSQLNVSEVAYKVGFNNPKYFTKYFKEEFGVLPSKYSESLDS